MIILNPLFALLSLALTAINIVEFFLLVRAIMMWKEVAWLKPFDTAGKPLTISFTTRLDNLFYRIRSKHLSEKGRIIAGLVLLELARAIISGAC